MIKLTVLYGPPTNVQEFENYYAETHLPIAAKMKGVDRLELTRFAPGPDGGQPAYYRMAELYFPTEEQMQATMSSPEGEATVADLPKFATGVKLGTIFRTNLQRSFWNFSLNIPPYFKNARTYLMPRWHSKVVLHNIQLATVIPSTLANFQFISVAEDQYSLF